MNKVVIYTDGACKGNPGPGGWGVLLRGAGQVEKELLQGASEWLAGWKAKGWRTASKQPVKNVDLWQKLDALLHTAGHHIEWVWVKGHAGDPGNERADMLANRGVEQMMAST